MFKMSIMSKNATGTGGGVYSPGNKKLISGTVGEQLKIGVVIDAFPKGGLKKLYLRDIFFKL